MKRRYIVGMILGLGLVWFYRHSLISMLPAEMGGNLNICGPAASDLPPVRTIAVELLPISSKIEKQEIIGISREYEVELENKSIVQVRKIGNSELVGLIKSNEDACFEYMDEKSSEKWYEYLEQMYQNQEKIKLP